MTGLEPVGSFGVLGLDAGLGVTGLDAGLGVTGLDAGLDEGSAPAARPSWSFTTAGADSCSSGGTVSRFTGCAGGSGGCTGEGRASSAAGSSGISREGGWVGGSTITSAMACTSGVHCVCDWL